MKRILLLSFALITLISFGAMAQRTVSGKLVDDSGESLPGVNVVIKGTTTGVTSDLDGNYQISVDDGATLVFSYVGFETQEVAVGARTTIDVTMGGATELQEVVVTAQGIQREKRALGYAVTSVGGEEVEKVPETDVMRSLRGKVPGMNITQTSGVSGTGTNIVIRGYTTISGSNQPLFIVDGVPFNANTNNDNETNDFLEGGQSTSSRFLDLDPNNIESINVLKGLSATVKYGQLGRNGVILITTKNGRQSSTSQKLEVTVQQSYHVTEIASLPDYQNNYGNGFHQNFGFFFSNWGPNFNTRGERGINADGTIAHPLSRLSDPTLASQFPEYADQTIEYRSYQPTENFFNKGNIATTSVQIRGGSDKASMSGTFAYTDDTGFLPNNNLQKLNFGLGGIVDLSNNVTLSSSMNFVETRFQTPPISYGSGSGIGVGTGANVFADIFYTPRNIPLQDFPFIAPVDNRSVYYRSGNDIQSPYWTANYSSNTANTRRFYSSTSAVYDVTDWLSLTYRLGLDTYNENREYILNKGSVQNDDYINGVYRTTNIVNTIWDHSFIVQAQRELNSDLTLTALVGGNIRQDQFARDGVESQSQIVFGFIEHANFQAQSAVNSFSGLDIQRKQEEILMGIYAEATLDYKNYLFLNLQARNDWSSTVESANNSLLYPGVSLSFIPTDAFGISSNILNYLKTRISYGTSAGFPVPYSTRSISTSTGRAYVDRAGNVLSSNSGATYFIDNGAGSVLGNPDLKPELQKELEFGVEAKLFSNRVGIDMSYYRRTTEDLITQATLDPSTGFTSTNINIGEVSNNGIELGITANPVKTNSFSWNINWNFFQYESTVEELSPQLDRIRIAGFSNLGNFAVAGEPFNVMYGSAVQRDENGNAIIDGVGLWTPTDEIQRIGDPNPDFTTSVTNILEFKGVSLSVQIDYRAGGDFYSGTARAMMARGLTTDTDFDRTQNFVLDGVTADGQVNTQIITATNLYFDNYGFGPSEVSVFDGTTIRLRDVSLSYSLPSAILANTPFGDVTLTLTGTNLWYNAINLPQGSNVDTDALGLGANGNGLGFEFLNGPSAKRYGGSIRVRF